MNFEDKKVRMAIIGIMAVLVLGWTAIAIHDLTRPKPKYSLWTRYDEHYPWFDGKDWDWFMDMVNQKSLKPQAEGTIQAFPLDSVPRTGVEVGLKDPESEAQRSAGPKNPTQATVASVAHGKVMYETYCGTCHGVDGQAGTPVSEKGLFAPPLVDVYPARNESFIYNKIRYGGPIMPSYAIQTSPNDRWDIVNYLKSKPFKGK